MKKRSQLILLFICLECAVGMIVKPLKIEIGYVNHKYVNYYNFTMRKYKRGSPYYINIAWDLKYTLGNNVTVTGVLFEHISGRYIPTPMNVKYKLCDIFDEPLLGGIAKKQLSPLNISCPFPPGPTKANNLTLLMDDYPYLDIFTWSDLNVQCRLDVNTTLTKTAEPIIKFSGIFAVIQSLESKSRKFGKKSFKNV